MKRVVPFTVLLGALVVAMLAQGVASAPLAQETPVPTPPPTSTPRPAPVEDRVGFPQGYQTDYQTFFVMDRPDNKQVRVIYANAQAAQAQSGQPFPYDSVLVMETYRAVADEAGTPVLDDAGRYQRGELTGIFVMRKGPDFGAAYEEFRTGEWEYVAFRPDGSYLAPPSATGNCAACHTDAGGTRDWVFRGNLYFERRSGALPQADPALAAAGRVSIQQYLFLPDTITVAAGTTVTWANEDEAIHTVTAADGSFDSGRMAIGALYSHTYGEPGVFEYRCLIHPAMQATVVVEAPPASGTSPKGAG